MKKEIKNITREQLVDLLCTATYGSAWLDCGVSRETREKIDITVDDCREDIWAKALIAGERIEAIDYYAEGELYGTLGTAVTCDKDENGHYNLTLDDIKKGLQRAWDGTFKANDEGEKEWAHKCVEAFLDQDDTNDLTEAEALMQIIMFDELIYG